MTIYSKKPVNWKVPKQYPSVFIFLRQGVGRHGPHINTHVCLCVYSHLKKERANTDTLFRGTCRADEKLAFKCCHTNPIHSVHSQLQHGDNPHRQELRVLGSYS